MRNWRRSNYDKVTGVCVRGGCPYTSFPGRGELSTCISGQNGHNYEFPSPREVSMPFLSRALRFAVVCLAGTRASIVTILLFAGFAGLMLDGVTPVYGQGAAP